MSKVQTFEEWWESDGQMRHSLSFKDSMEAAWQAAMENAARVCEGDACDQMASNVERGWIATEIRKAAKEG